MTDTEILAKVKLGIDLFLEKTYTMDDLYSHMLQVIADNSASGTKHKEQLERLMFKVEELRENQRLFHGGHKQLLGACRSQEDAMDKKIFHLQQMGYDTNRFKKQKPQQRSMF